MKFLPPGRGLWAMGSPITEDRQLYAALNNCAFVSTSNLRDGPARPFCFLMDAAMLGVGVGFDTAGAVRRLCVERLVSCRSHHWCKTCRVMSLSRASTRASLRCHTVLVTREKVGLPRCGSSLMPSSWVGRSLSLTTRLCDLLAPQSGALVVSPAVLVHCSSFTR